MNTRNQDYIFTLCGDDDLRGDDRIKGRRVYDTLLSSRGLEEENEIVQIMTVTHDILTEVACGKAVACLVKAFLLAFPDQFTRAVSVLESGFVKGAKHGPRFVEGCALGIMQAAIYITDQMQVPATKHNDIAGNFGAFLAESLVRNTSVLPLSPEISGEIPNIAKKFLAMAPPGAIAAGFVQRDGLHQHKATERARNSRDPRPEVQILSELWRTSLTQLDAIATMHLIYAGGYSQLLAGCVPKRG